MQTSLPTSAKTQESIFPHVCRKNYDKLRDEGATLTDENTTRNTPKVKLSRLVLLGIPLVRGSSRGDSRGDTEQERIIDKWCSVLILNPGSRKKAGEKVYTGDG